VGKGVFEYFKGRFTAVVAAKNGSMVEWHTFSKLEFHQVQISGVVPITGFKPEEHRAGPHLYRETLIVGRKKWHQKLNPFIKQGFVLFPHSADQIYSGKIHQVVFKKFQLIDQGERMRVLSPGYFLLQGEVYFGRPRIPVVVAVPQGPAGQPPTPPQPTLISEQLQNQLNKGCFNPIMSTSQALNSVAQQATQSAPANFVSNNAKGCLSRLWQALVFFFLIVMSFIIGQFMPLLGLLSAILSVLWLISRWIPSFPFRSWYGWALLGLFFVFIIMARQSLQTDFQPQETEDGAVRQEKPEEYVLENDRVKMKDYRFNKSITWFDFSKRSYQTEYATTSINYFQSKDKREAMKTQNLGDNQVEYMANLYGRLLANDQPKLDSLARDLKKKALTKNLNALQTAEMVTTMVQEIDYVLVHDNSCKQSSEEDGDFVRDYHKARKPCLPNIFAGVQSPYEFTHNLKGDCDTRTLLAHALLTRLGISSSVWISTVYGHSVLGVGVPVGFGSYKEVGGVKHFGVELTSKGFKIGMLVPEQRNMRNWVVTNYKNISL